MPAVAVALHDGSSSVVAKVGELEKAGHRVVGVSQCADGVVLVYEKRPGRPPKQVETR